MSHRTGQATFNVKTYGAKGDNSTNDYTVIAAAVAAAGIAGGTVEFPPGTYVVGTALSVPANVTLWSSGHRAAVFASTGSGQAITLAGDGATVDGLYITHATTSVAIAASVKNVTIKNCKFTNGVQTIYTNNTGIVGVDIENNLFDGCGYAILVNTAATDIRDIRITNNRFVNITSDAIELNTPGAEYTGCHYVSITGNYISTNAGSSGSSGFGVGICGGAFITIANNNFVACRVQAIHVESLSRHVTVSGNIVDGQGTGVSGITFLDGAYCSIIGNEVYNTTGTGIECVNQSGPSTYVTITGNTVKGVGTYGFLLNNANGIISNNIAVSNGSGGFNINGSSNIRVTGNRATLNTGYGMWISNVSTLGEFTHNNCAGNTLGAITISSSVLQLPVLTHDQQETLNVVASGATLPDVPLFSIGTYAKGTVFMTARRGSDVRSVMYDLQWDGTTLFSKATQQSNIGSFANAYLGMTSVGATATIFITNDGSNWATSDTATVTINGHTTVYTVGGTVTTSAIATGLAAAINADSTSNLLVTAVASSSNVTLTAKAAATAANYTLTATKSSTHGLVDVSGTTIGNILQVNSFGCGGSGDTSTICATFKGQSLSATSVGAGNLPVQSVTASTATITRTCDRVDVNYAGACALTFPTLFTGKGFTIKDISGAASPVNVITFVAGAGSTIERVYKLDVPYGSISFYLDGSVWRAN